MVQRILMAAILLFSSSAIYSDNTNEIIEVDKAFSQLSAKHGRKAAYEHYLATNAVSLEQAALPLHGRQNILKGFDVKDGDPTVTATWKPQDGFVAASSDLAYTWGIYTASITADDTTTVAQGKYTSIWKKENGSWKLVVDISNDNPHDEGH